uniref:Capsid protein n=1 Tax=Florenciella sp. virus SA2 TaxID=3240092 RepID=A0AB39JD96_9VIRU
MLRIDGKAESAVSEYTYVYGSHQGLQTGAADDAVQAFLTPMRTGGSKSSNALYPSIANVKWGNINTSYDVSQQQVWRDHLRHISNRVTGGYSALDLFANEEEMGAEIRGLDLSLNEQIASDICANAADTFMADFAATPSVSDLSNNRIRFMAYNMFRRMLSDAADSNANPIFENSSLGKKFKKFIDDLSNNSSDGSGNATYTGSFGFNNGDALAFKVTYVPAYSGGNAPIGNNVITTRSFKVFIKLTVNDDTTVASTFGTNFHASMEAPEPEPEPAT